MAESDNVLTKLHDLLVYLVPQLSRFPRDQKFVLGDRIEVKVLEVQESCLRAYYGRDKRPHLLEANLTLEVTRHLIRLAHALRYFSNHTYGVVSEKVDVVGRMIGGWLRAERGHSCPMPLGIEGVEPLPNAVWPLSGRDFKAGTTAIRLPSRRRDDRSRQLRPTLLRSWNNLHCRCFCAAALKQVPDYRSGKDPIDFSALDNSSSPIVPAM